MVKQVPDVRFLILGEVADKPYYQRCLKIVEEHHLQDNVEWGETSKAYEAYNEAHVFVLASKTAANGDMEGIPVALMEAMAQGMPVLATIHSGTPELVEHGVSGFLNDEGDWRTLSANMRQLAETSERWAQMGAAGAAKVRAEFDLKLWNDRLLERLTQLWGSVTTASARANTSP